MMEWIDYTKQSPRIGGRYQIFISSEQLTAEYKHPFGFACPIDGCAFVQELITHWALLPEPPKVQEQASGLYHILVSFGHKDECKGLDTKLPFELIDIKKEVS